MHVSSFGALLHSFDRDKKNMSKQDYYSLLGVSRSASADEIKKAYRKLAMKYHPDRNQGDKAAEQKFKEVTQAYEVLQDEQKRAAYDRYGHDAFEQGGMGAGRGGGGGFGGGGFDFHTAGFSDIFEEVFGDFMGGGGGRKSASGSDLRYDVQITLEESFKGTQKQLKVPTLGSCDPCGGTGSQGGGVKSCTTCQGLGKVRSSQGFFTIERTCPTCGGQGRVIENPCRYCGGAGRTRKEKTLAVSIPAGVDDGTRIRLSGEGEAGIRGASPGDLYVFVSVKKHKFFERDGADLHCKVPIPMVTACLGGSIEVPTIEGTRAKVTIPTGTQSGHKFRLKAKGMPILRSSVKGDMYIHVDVETPVNLTKRQKELMQEFHDLDPKDQSSPESAGFFKRVKEFWQDLKD